MATLILPALQGGILTSAWANAELWDGEYGDHHSIPSSFRIEPSHTFVALEEELRVRPGMRVLDAGCGTGRHALYLADRGCEVDAVDISRVACDVLLDRRERLVPDGSKSRLDVINAELSPGCLPDARYDLILDSYVSCHMLNDDERLAYLEALRSLLRPDGVLYTSAMGEDDQFYAAHATTGPDGGQISTDPINGITKRLQSKLTFRDRISNIGPTGRGVAEHFLDSVGNDLSKRQVLAATLLA